MQFLQYFIIGALGILGGERASGHGLAYSADLQGTVYVFRATQMQLMPDMKVRGAIEILILNQYLYFFYILLNQAPSPAERPRRRMQYSIIHERPPPWLILQIPAYGLCNSLGKILPGMPMQLGSDLSGVQAVSGIMPRPILYKIY